jgi:hypothetical protein
MSETVLQEYERLEAERLALARKYHQWSLVMVKVMIEELEKKLLDDDEAVDEDDKAFWENL